MAVGLFVISNCILFISHRFRTCSITSAAKSLDLLRQNLQKSINKDIDKVIQSYIEVRLQPVSLFYI